MELGWNVPAMFLFLLEAYHVIAHCAVLCRIRLLPRKDLVRVRYYFLIDGLSSFVVAFLYTGQLRWLVSLHVLQHLYYYFFWEKTHLAKRIVDWSSLDWFQSPLKGGLELDNILGTLFDVVVHTCNLYILGSYLSTVQIVISLVVAKTSAFCIFYNPRLAWSSPSSMPAWVQKRVQPLASQEEVQED